jgi:response regulator of citrate/malate metabolism
MELQRMNQTLARFESRISTLGREKKTLERDLDTMRQKQTMS